MLSSPRKTSVPAGWFVLAASITAVSTLQAQRSPGDEILNMQILYEASNHIEIEVAYAYGGKQDPSVWIAPDLLTHDGQDHAAQLANQPGRVTPGRATTWTRLYFTAPPYGDRPSRTNQVALTMYEGEPRRRVARRVFDWPTSHPGEAGPRLLTAVTSRSVEQTSRGLRPAPAWGWGGGFDTPWAYAPSYLRSGGRQPDVCRFLVFENLSARSHVVLAVHRNEKPAGEQSRVLVTPAPDRSYTTYDATTSTYFCNRRAQGRWEEFVLLNGRRVGVLRYYVDIDIHTDRRS